MPWRPRTPEAEEAPHDQRHLSRRETVGSLRKTESAPGERTALGTTQEEKDNRHPRAKAKAKKRKAKEKAKTEKVKRRKETAAPRHLEVAVTGHETRHPDQKSRSLALGT